jgi:hypothetical protein
MNLRLGGLEEVTSSDTTENKTDKRFVVDAWRDNGEGCDRRRECTDTKEITEKTKGRKMAPLRSRRFLERLFMGVSYVLILLPDNPR